MMGLFNRKKDIEIPNESSYDIEVCLKEALKLASEMRIKLNYTNESVTRLDILLLAYYEDAKENPVSIETMQNTARIFGVYLGEVIRRNWLFEYRWTDYNVSDYQRPVLEKNMDEVTSFIIDPTNEVLKRMLNGAVSSTYKYFRDIQNKAINHEL